MNSKMMRLSYLVAISYIISYTQYAVADQREYLSHQFEYLSIVSDLGNTVLIVGEHHCKFGYYNLRKGYRAKFALTFPTREAVASDTNLVDVENRAMMSSHTAPSRRGGHIRDPRLVFVHLSRSASHDWTAFDNRGYLRYTALGYLFTDSYPYLFFDLAQVRIDILRCDLAVGPTAALAKTVSDAPRRERELLVAILLERYYMMLYQQPSVMSESILKSDLNILDEIDACLTRRQCEEFIKTSLFKQDPG